MLTEQIGCIWKKFYSQKKEGIFLNSEFCYFLFQSKIAFYLKII